MLNSKFYDGHHLFMILSFEFVCLSYAFFFSPLNSHGIIFHSLFILLNFPRRNLCLYTACSNWETGNCYGHSEVIETDKFTLERAKECRQEKKKKQKFVRLFLPCALRICSRTNGCMAGVYA